jgi:hypothetical protein
MASLLIESRDPGSIGQPRAHRQRLPIERAGALWASAFLLEVGSAPARAVPAFLSLDTSCSAVTTSTGTCSKCVWDFRVASFDLRMMNSTEPRVIRVISFGNRVASLALTKALD